MAMNKALSKFWARVSSCIDEILSVARLKLLPCCAIEVAICPKRLCGGCRPVRIRSRFRPGGGMSPATIGRSAAVVKVLETEPALTREEMW